MSSRDRTAIQSAGIAAMRTVFLRRSTGFLSFPSSPARLYFRDGELQLAADDDAASLVEARLAGLGGAKAAGDRPLVELTRAVVGDALSGATGEPRFDGGSDRFPARLIGPLPTVAVLLETSVEGLDDSQLVGLLGGPQARLQNSPQSPAMQQLPGLDTDMLQLMAHLESPTPIEQLLRLHANQGSTTLRAAVRLWAVGLAQTDGDPTTGRGSASRRRRRREARRGNTDDGKALSARALELFSERIADDLERNPPTEPVESHRRWIAERLERHAEMSFYELLGVDPKAEDAALHEGFRTMGRQVHPIHATRLGLQGWDEGLKILFERVTEAYLVLSDPRRRASYNLLQGINLVEAVDENKRLEERRKMAASCYSNALHALADHVQDYGQAVNLLKEAARLDPQAQYFSLLGQALAHNPRWRSQAAGAFARAVELDPKNAGIHVAYAELLEKTGDVTAARNHFAAALEDMPNHPTALKALERLGRPSSSSSVAGGGLRRLFGGKKT